MANQPESVSYEPYHGAYEAIEDIKFLVKLWLQRHLALYASRYKKQDDNYSDLYVGKNEVNAFLGGEIGLEPEKAEEIQAIRSAEARYRDFLQGRAEATAAAGKTLPIEDFRAAFGLADDRLMDVVLALLVVELEPEFIRAYSHAWCDFTQKEVELGFLLELVSQTVAERDRLCHLFVTQEHPLFTLGALRVAAPTADAHRSLMRRGAWLSDRVVSWFCGARDVPVTVTGTSGGLRQPERSLDDVLLPADVKTSVKRAFASLFRAGVNTNYLYLHGGDGTGKLSLCEVAASQLGRPLLVGHCAEFAERPGEFGARLVTFLCEVRLHNAVAVLAGAETLDAKDDKDGTTSNLLRTLRRITQRSPDPLLLSGTTRIPSLADALPGLLEIAVPHPTPAVQRELWKRTLPAKVQFVPGFSVEDIVQRYSLTGGAIKKVATAVMRGSPRKGAGLIFSPKIVLPVIRDHLRHRLGSLAIPVARGSTWDDMIVSKRTKEALIEIVSFVRNRELIVTDWGFGSKVSYGRGVAALFYGAPGTGKTMAAGCMGVDLGMEVFQIDLSKIVDKYIGETEKNLARVFEEGSRAQAILLFDEADSLFSKRTAVKSSTDRYANLEVNFLLQMIEAYEGISILTSNFPEAIDEAFKRRIRFKVEFPFPKMKERMELWKVMLPEQAPTSDDVDFECLAKEYELSGAHIKNVVLRTASMAAQAGGIMDMDTFVKAANREYHEMGKIVREYEDD